MTTINVPLDEITGTDFSTTPDVWLGTRDGDPEVKGMARFPEGKIPYDTGEIDKRLAALGVVLGDWLETYTDERGAVWIVLHSSWSDDDARWLLTEAGEAAITTRTFEPGTRVRRTDDGRTGTVDPDAVGPLTGREHHDMVPVQWDGDDAWLTSSRVLVEA